VVAVNIQDPKAASWRSPMASIPALNVALQTLAAFVIFMIGIRVSSQELAITVHLIHR
jgi:hypothetical protein